MNTHYDFTGARLNDTAAKGIATRWIREHDAMIDTACLKLKAEPSAPPCRSRKGWLALNKRRNRTAMAGNTVTEWQLSKHVWALVYLDPLPQNGALWVFSSEVNSKAFTTQIFATNWRISVHALERSIERSGGVYDLVTPREIMRVVLGVVLDGEHPPGAFSVSWSYGVVLGGLEPDGGILVKTVIPAAALTGNKRELWETLKPDEVHLAIDTQAEH